MKIGEMLEVDVPDSPTTNSQFFSATGTPAV